MKKSFVVLLHIGFLTCYLLLIVIIVAVYYRSGNHLTHREFRVTNALKTLLLFAVVGSFISYTLNYYVLFPRFFQQKKYLLSIVFGMLISAGAALTGYLLLRHYIEAGRIIDMDQGGKNGRSTAPGVIFAMTIISSICGVVALVIKGFVTWFNEIKVKEILKEKNHEMEMAMIRLQLDPHLLFNTINNIDALILKDAAAASDYLNKLSDIMRFILYETKTEQISLSKEIEYIDKYIALQKIRTANENYVQLTVTGTVGNTLIAPMIFIPFIENAFKHSGNKKIKNAITVNIIIKDKSIQLLCENKYDPMSKAQQPDSGLGNELIQKRLTLVYGGKHTLEVHKTNELYCVNLTIVNG
jgi:two-component system, LytTR family, sensor kinase